MKKPLATILVGAVICAWADRPSGTLSPAPATAGRMVMP